LRENRIFPFLAEHILLDTRDTVANWGQTLRLPQMRVLLLALGYTATNNISAYTRGIDKCELILAEIEKDLR
jgi:hypothetical protein